MDGTNKQQPLARTRAPDRDPWSLQIARVAGIPIRLHFTFLLLIGWILFTGLGAPENQTLRSTLFVLGLFGCVCLHELGHSLVALRYGIPVASITLYPIGGISRITKRPKPYQELWITLAGPAVNLLIAIGLWAVVSARGDQKAIQLVATGHEGLLADLLAANIMLFVFNLLPAFPMDGGRILRSLLAVIGVNAAVATRVAASVGQVIAILMALLAILPHTPFSGNWILILIAVFVYFGAGQEAAVVQQEASLQGIPVSQVMLTQIETLRPGMSLREAAERLLSTSQQDFPVVHGDEVVGLMTRNGLLQGLANQGPDAYVAGTMRRDFPTAAPADDIAQILASATDDAAGIGQRLPLVVMDAGRLVGMVTGENIAEYSAIHRILAQGRHRWHDQTM